VLVLLSRALGRPGRGGGGGGAAAAGDGRGCGVAIACSSLEHLAGTNRLGYDVVSG